MRGAGSRVAGDESSRNAFDRHLLLYRTLLRAMDTSSTIRAHFTLSAPNPVSLSCTIHGYPIWIDDVAAILPINEYPVFKYGVLGNGYRYDL